MNQSKNTMKSENNNSEITINVLPDNQAMGKTLNALLAYLQFYKVATLKPYISSKVDFSKWVEYLKEIEGIEISRNGEYITNPIRINLSEGEYVINANVRVFTLSDFAIIGKGAATVIRFDKFDLRFDNLHEISAYKNSVNCIALIASPWAFENISEFKSDNSFLLKDFAVQVTGGVWFPCILSETGTESEIGVLLSFANFHNAEVTGVSVIAKDNGELTLMDTNECDHQKITDCYFYLNNWFDRTTGPWSKQNPEQGANLNIRGNHKSVLIARNTFIKHGMDEALTFLQGSEDATKKFVHENI